MEIGNEGANGMKEDITGEIVKRKAEQAASALGVDISTMSAEMGTAIWKNTENIAKQDRISYDRMCELYATDPEYSWTGKWIVASYRMEKDYRTMMQSYNDFKRGLTGEEIRYMQRKGYDDGLLLDLWEKGFRKKMKKLNKEQHMGLSRRDIDQMVKDALEGRA